MGIEIVYKKISLTVISFHPFTCINLCVLKVDHSQCALCI